MKKDKGSGAKVKSKDKAKKAKLSKPEKPAKSKPIKKKKAAPVAPWSIKVHYPGIVEVVGQIVKRTEEGVILRQYVKRSRGKVADTTYPARDIVAIFSANAEESTLLVRTTSYTYQKFEAISLEVVGGVYRITDEEGFIHLVHPDYCHAAQLHDADNAPPIALAQTRLVEDDEDEEEDDESEEESEEEDEEEDEEEEDSSESESEDDDEDEEEDEEEEDDEEEEEDDAPPFKPSNKPGKAPVQAEEDEGEYE